MVHIVAAKQVAHGGIQNHIVNAIVKPQPDVTVAVEAQREHGVVLHSTGCARKQHRAATERLQHHSVAHSAESDVVVAYSGAKHLRTAQRARDFYACGVGHVVVDIVWSDDCAIVEP